MSNIQELAYKIYSQPPRQPNTIQLNLDLPQNKNYTAEDAKNIRYHFLYNLTTKGIIILFGNRRLKDLTEREFNRIQEYVNSYGYVLRIYTNNTKYNPWEILRMGETIRFFKVAFEKFEKYKLTNVLTFYDI